MQNEPQPKLERRDRVDDIVEWLRQNAELFATEKGTLTIHFGSGGMTAEVTKKNIVIVKYN